MYYTDLQIVLQEVPGEISICFTISGCKLQCKGCHSPNLWKVGFGELLSEELYQRTLLKYKDLASCVLFMGGEWHPKELLKFLNQAQLMAYNTCLYTGEEDVSQEIKSALTWLKIGPWCESLGGLDSPETNQKYIEIKTQTILNRQFLKN